MTASQSTLCGVDEMKRPEAEQLFYRNTRLAHYLLHVYYPASSQDEDLHQEALLGLWNACITYDRSKSQFSTYAGRCILNQIRQELRRRARQPDTVSLNSPVTEDDGVTLEDCLEDPCPDTYEDWFALKLFFEGLNEEQRKIIQYRTEGLTQQQIAANFGRSKVWVSRTLKRLQEIYLRQEDQDE